MSFFSTITSFLNSIGNRAIRIGVVVLGVILVVVIGFFLIKLYEIFSIPFTPENHVEEFQLPEKTALKIRAGEEELRELSEQVNDNLEEKKDFIQAQAFEADKIQEIDIAPIPLQVFSEEMVNEFSIPGRFPELNPR